MNVDRIILLLALTFTAGSLAAAPVGRVILAAGNASAIRDGNEIPLAFGSTIEPKDILRTAAGSSLQVRFSDDSIKSLRENTEFAIEDFKFSGKEDGSERAVFRLIKGGFRALTGLVGRTNHASYEVRTVTATIGIRGTDFVVRDCRGDCGEGIKDGLYGSVVGMSRGTNQITLTNKAGEFVFGINQHFHVPDAGSRPQPLLQPPGFVAARPQGQAQAVKEGGSGGGNEKPAAGTGIITESRPTLVTETVAPVVAPVVQISTNYQASQDSNQPASVPVVVAATGIISGNGVYPASNSLFFLSAEYNPSSSAHNAFNNTSGAITTDTSGLLTAASNSYRRNDAQVLEAGADGGVIAWGRWAGGTPTLSGWGLVALSSTQGFHILSGVAATSPPAQNGVTFSLIGATTPTETRAGALGGWSVTSGSMTANFLSASLNGTLGLSVRRADATGDFTMAFNASSAISGIVPVSASIMRSAGSTTLCTSLCSGSGTLTFAGTGASHAGMIYEFNTGAYYVQGAAAFKR